MQFASAAVVMFRMFGLPARYVVGYAAPQSLFTQQEDGSWHAILQDDNAHAWAEVYISGQGWTPMEMTPGVLVSAQQADLRTDPLPGNSRSRHCPRSRGEQRKRTRSHHRAPQQAGFGGVAGVACWLLRCCWCWPAAMPWGMAGAAATRGCWPCLAASTAFGASRPAAGYTIRCAGVCRILQSCVPALEPQDAEALLALAQAAQFGAGTMTEQDTDKMRKLYQVIKHTGKRKQSQKSVEKQSQE